MKSLKLILGLVLILTVVSSFILRGTKEQTTNPPLPETNQFLTGAMSAGWQTDYSKLRDTLGFNLWHRYINGGMESGQLNIHGWTQSDELNAPIGNYSQDVRDILTDNDTWGMRTLMERPKITRLAFGQRSDYQCEASSIDPGLWFYAYSDHHNTGSDVYDNDQNYGSDSWVRKYQIPTQTPGQPQLVISGLKANREQVNMSERWEGDYAYSWIIKPRIRADKDYVNSHSDEPICRIDVINYEGQLIKSTVLRARNLKLNGYYDGNYKEEFNFDIPNGDSTLSFQQWQSINFNPRRSAWFVPDGACKVDYKVYWYGNCDMWIDYVRVDNDVADELFKGFYDNTWINWEAVEIARHTSSPYKFYIEEFEFNNLPCMSYLSEKLRYYNPYIGLMCNLNFAQYNTMMPFPNWGNMKYVDCEHIKRFLIDSLGSTEIFTGSYPFGGHLQSFGEHAYSVIPNTLCGTQTYNADNGMLTHSYFQQTYDTFFKNNLATP